MRYEVEYNQFDNRPFYYKTSFDSNDSAKKWIFGLFEQFKNQNCSFCGFASETENNGYAMLGSNMLPVASATIYSKKNDGEYITEYSEDEENYYEYHYYSETAEGAKEWVKFMKS